MRCALLCFVVWIGCISGRSPRRSPGRSLSPSKWSTFHSTTDVAKRRAEELHVSRQHTGRAFADTRKWVGDYRATSPESPCKLPM